MSLHIFSLSKSYFFQCSRSGSTLPGVLISVHMNNSSLDKFLLSEAPVLQFLFLLICGLVFLLFSPNTRLLFISLQFQESFVYYPALQCTCCDTRFRSIFLRSSITPPLPLDLRLFARETICAARRSALILLSAHWHSITSFPPRTRSKLLARNKITTNCILNSRVNILIVRDGDAAARGR